MLLASTFSSVLFVEERYPLLTILFTVKSRFLKPPSKKKLFELSGLPEIGSEN